MAVWIVKIGASKAGSVDGLYYIKRTYEIHGDDENVNDLAIARAYLENLEHVRVEQKFKKEVFVDNDQREGCSLSTNTQS